MMTHDERYAGVPGFEPLGLRVLSITRSCSTFRLASRSATSSSSNRSRRDLRYCRQAGMQEAGTEGHGQLTGAHHRPVCGRRRVAMAAMRCESELHVGTPFLCEGTAVVAPFVGVVAAVFMNQPRVAIRKAEARLTCHWLHLRACTQESLVHGRMCHCTHVPTAHHTDYQLPQAAPATRTRPAHAWRSSRLATTQVSHALPHSSPPCTPNVPARPPATHRGLAREARGGNRRRPH